MCHVVSKISGVVSEKKCRNVEKKWVSRFSECGFETTCLCGVETNKGGVETGLQLLLCVDLIFASLYLTGQLESMRVQKFQLAGIVLVVSNPHVFNLTGQLDTPVSRGVLGRNIIRHRNSILRK